MSSATLARRGTTNRNARGSAEDRRRRREWLVETYRANADECLVAFDGVTVVRGVDSEHVERFIQLHEAIGATVVVAPACRCYRCGCLLTADTVTVDRIIPGCQGGTYRRDNIRPACGHCNSETGGALASKPKRRRKTKEVARV